MEQTAVELAIDKIKELQSNTEIGHFTKRAYAICMDILEDTKEMEKQQMKECWKKAQDEQRKEFSSNYCSIKFEEYYNKVYGK